MKTNKLFVLSVTALTALTLAACGTSTAKDSTTVTPQTETPASEKATSETPATSADVTSEAKESETPTTEAPKEIYGVVVIDVEHVTLTADKTTASPGDTVTLTCSVDNGYLLKSITVNGTAIDGLTFTMPYKGVVITATIAPLDTNGIYIDGDITTALSLDSDTGLYVAKNVKVSSKSSVHYVVSGETLSATALDNTKCLADLGIDGNNGFTIHGGASYDFYYDPTNASTPCYVVRTSVDELPHNEDTFKTLFDGSVKSESTNYPSGLTSVSFNTTATSELYTWDLYSDYSSLATVKNTKTGKDRAIVYKSIDAGVYTVVDNYLNQSMNVYDPTRYSAKYDVVNKVSVGMGHYQKLESEAKKDAVSYDHGIQSIGYDIMNAVWWGHSNDISDDQYTYDVQVSSVANEDGSFTTTATSWTTVIPGGTDYSYVDSAYHNEYQLTAEYTKEGKLLTLDYEVQEYNSNEYDFDNEKFLTGGKDQPEDENSILVTYTYGEAKEGKPTTDLTPYFVSEITGVTAQGSNGVANEFAKQDELTQNPGEFESELENDYVSFEFLPTTALDAWQYGITKSSDTSVIKLSDQYLRWQAVGYGETTLTLGNHTASTGATYDFKVSVPEPEDGDIKSVWAYTVYPYNNDNWGASSGTIAAGTIDKVKLCATLTNNKYDQNADLTLTSSSEYLKVTYDQSTGYMTLDATDAAGITEKVSVTITIDCAYNTAWKGSSKDTLTVTITPSAYVCTDVVGTWNYAYADGETAESTGYECSVVFTNEEAAIEGGTYKAGTLTMKATEDGTTDVYVVNFGYTFDKDTQKFTSKAIDATKNGSAYANDPMDDLDLYLAMDNENGYLDVYCAADIFVEGEDFDDSSIETYLICGGYEAADEDELDDTYYYDPFTKAE